MDNICEVYQIYALFVVPIYDFGIGSKLRFLGKNQPSKFIFDFFLKMSKKIYVSRLLWIYLDLFVQIFVERGKKVFLRTRSFQET